MIYIHLRKVNLGIGLLETLAALVILSAGAAVMLTWFSQNATSLGRLKDAERIEQGRLDALEYLRTVNPVEKPRGEVTFNQFRITWTSKQTGETVRALTALGSPGKYAVSLYELNVQLFSLDQMASDPAVKLMLPVTGYKLVAPTSGGMFGPGS